MVLLVLSKTLNSLKVQKLYQKLSLKQLKPVLHQLSAVVTQFLQLRNSSRLKISLTFQQVAVLLLNSSKVKFFLALQHWMTSRKNFLYIYQGWLRRSRPFIIKLKQNSPTNYFRSGFLLYIIELYVQIIREINYG